MNSLNSIPVNRAGAVLLAAVLLCAACQTQPPVQQRAAAVPAQASAPPLPVTSPHYRIRAADSHLRILVYKGGPLAAFGHNHVITAGEIQGDVYLTPDMHNAGFRFTVPVLALVVDPPAARAEEGGDFASRPSPEAVAGTRQNMLGPGVLDAQRYPDIVIRSIAVTGPDWALDVTARVTLHGVSRDLTVPVSLLRGDGRIIASGTFDLKQSDFGITPFAVMGGGLQVQDTVRVRFRLTAVKAGT